MAMIAMTIAAPTTGATFLVLAAARRVVGGVIEFGLHRTSLPVDIT